MVSNTGTNVSNVGITVTQSQQQQYVGTMQQGTLTENNNHTKIIDSQVSAITQTSIQQPQITRQQQQQQQITHQQQQQQQQILDFFFW